MDILHPAAVIGTNAWGSETYGKLVRGSYVDETTIRESLELAKEKDLLIFDLAQDYGFGKAQKMIGMFGTEDIILSSKFTPMKGYKPGQVRKSLEKDLWAVLEEGMLTDPRIKTSKSIMKILFNRKKRKLHSLYVLMNKIGKRHDITIPQVAMSFVSSKGIVPICGCRKPYQVEQLYEATNVKLSDKEIKLLEEEADRLNVKILGADMFRFAVRKHL